jgi:hypothetical protein
MRASTGRYALAGIACGLVLLAAFATQWWLGGHGRSLGGIGMIAFASAATWVWLVIVRRRIEGP